MVSESVVTTREVVIIVMDPDGGMWSAGATVKRRRGTCLTWPEYKVRGDSPEFALAALKKAVADGEEGWTW